MCDHQRSYQKHHDDTGGRFESIFVRTLQHTVESYLSEPNWEVDVYLILGCESLTTNQTRLVRDALPQSVGLEIWEDATPMNYGFGSKESATKYVAEQGISLARQHRYVVRDKLEFYDFFSCWEDDMRINSGHVKNFLQMSNEINKLRTDATNAQIETVPNSIRGALGTMQLDRLIPGFVRVEILGPDDVPKDFRIPLPNITVDNSSQIDPMACCSDLDRAKHLHNPHPDQVVVWETKLISLKVREFLGPLGWTVLLPTYKPRKDPDERTYIDGHWSGSNTSAFGARLQPKENVNPPPGYYFAQQAGWMLTRSQILHFHQHCDEGFVPPFDPPKWTENGLKPMNNGVEFWSGGHQLFTRCRAQRILSLNAKQFSKQLIWHYSNNKHHKRPPKARLSRMKNLFGQLISVKEVASKHHELITLEDVIKVRKEEEEKKKKE